LPKDALVIAVSSDGLFTLKEQQELAASIPGAQLVIVQSPDGHDGFLLEFEQINKHILGHLHKQLPEIYLGPPSFVQGGEDGGDDVKRTFSVKKASVFGEAEVLDEEGGFGDLEEQGGEETVIKHEVVASINPDVTRW